MIVPNERKTIKNLQSILEMSDIVILYEIKWHRIEWVGFTKDLPFTYVHRKIIEIVANNINIPTATVVVVYIE